MNDDRFLLPGSTCWRMAEANRFAVLIDGADFYRHVKQAILKARHQVLMIGWDFDTRIEFEPTGKTLDGPNDLGPFLNWMVKRKPALRIRILKWNLGVMETLKRGETPLFVLQWMLKRRVELKLDAAHPAGASHHQKIIVIDDAVAFCGGIDVTKARWDRREHLDGDPARRSGRGKLLGPWHDATTCADGDLAKALGDLGRARWKRATGETLAAPPADSDPWPDDLEPILTDVPVAISRTMGAYAEFPQVSEIETLYLTAIERARDSIYIESQYFASRRIAEALARRLREENGPEIVVINPDSQEGWLQEKTMGSARAKLLRLVRAADRHGRFGIFYPVTRGGAPIYVHAKIMIVDDRFLKIGSSNLNNRSMGFDTECDLSLEAGGTDARVSQAIRRARSDLIAEHLDATIENVDATLRETGSLISTIETLSVGTRRLVPLAIRDLDTADELLGENDLLDPERPPHLWADVKRRVGIRS